MISLLLPSPGDPLIIDTWINNYYKYEHLIDECLICINNLVSEKSVISDDIIKFWNSFNSKKIKIFYNHYLNDHGVALNFLYKQSKGDILLLMEDDDYIINVNDLKTHIEDVINDKYDVIGIPRNSCSKLITEMAKDKFNSNYPGFWPSLFICKRSILDMTDLHFSSKAFPKDVYIKEFDFTPSDDLSSDTMVYLSLQIRNINKIKIKHIDNSYHSSLDDEKYLKDPNFMDKILNIHVGSLSSTFLLKLFELENINLSIIENNIGNYTTNINIIREYMRRIEFLNYFLKKQNKNKYYYETYRKNLNFIYDKYSHYIPFSVGIMSTLTDKI